MKTIDAHQHFWNYSVEEYGWIDDSMEVLKKDFLPADLEPLLQNSGIGRSVAVQARTSVEETEWLLKLADENDSVAAVVGWLDLRSPQLEDQLKKYAANPKLVGLREILQGQEPEYMLDADFVRGVKLLGQYDLAYDLLVFPRHLKAVKQLLAQLPAQRLVIDHLAKPLIGEGLIDEWAEDMHDLAKHEHVYCKLSGMVTETGPDWLESDFTPYMEVIFDAFGEERIMYGSDWPVCLLRADYSQVCDIARNFVKEYSATAEEKVFGLNASKLYNIQLHNTKVLGNGENEPPNEQQNLNDASDGVVGHR